MQSAWIAFAAATIIGGTACGADDPKLEKLLEAWKAGKVRADAAMVRRFDQEIGKFTRNRQLPAAARNQRIEELKSQKVAFEQSGDAPSSDEMLWATIEYLDAIHEAAAPVRIHLERALQKAAGQGAEFDAIAAVERKWQAQLPRNGLGSRAQFHGTRTFNKGRTVDFHLHIDNLQNGIFDGEIWQDVRNVGGKTGWCFTAKSDGNRFEVATHKMLHGAPRQVRFCGYVIGDRIVMSVTNIGGKPVPGDLVSLTK